MRTLTHLPAKHIDRVGNYGGGGGVNVSRTPIEGLRRQAARMAEERRARGIPSGGDPVDVEALKMGRAGRVRRSRA